MKFSVELSEEEAREVVSITPASKSCMIYDVRIIAKIRGQIESQLSLKKEDEAEELAKKFHWFFCRIRLGEKDPESETPWKDCAESHQKAFREMGKWLLENYQRKEGK